MVILTNEQASAFQQNPSVNPLTGRVVRKDARLYKQLMKACEPSASDDCLRDKFHANHLVNPKTGRNIKRGGQIYKELVAIYGDPLPVGEREAADELAKVSKKESRLKFKEALKESSDRFARVDKEAQAYQTACDTSRQSLLEAREAHVALLETCKKHHEAQIAVLEKRAMDRETAHIAALEKKAMDRETANAEQLAEPDTNVCVICMASPVTTGFLHGGSVHNCVCDLCGQQVMRMGYKCPCCNVKIDKLIRVYTVTREV